MPPSTKILPPGVRDPALRNQSNPILKDSAHFEKYGAETNGEYARIRVKVGPSGAVPFHYHNSYTETFTAKEGELGVVKGDSTITLKPGDSVEVPKGTKHRFFNPSAEREIECMVLMTPAHEGFEKSLHIVYGMARDGLIGEDGFPPSLVRKCLIADMGDMRFPGIMMVMGMPIIRLVAGYDRWRGLEEELLQKYWY